MALVLVALGSFMLGLLCMGLLASAQMGDLELELDERSRRERREDVLETRPVRARAREALLMKVS